MNRMILVGLFLLNCSFGLSQVPIIPKFNPVIVKSLDGAPSRDKPELMTNIKYWIKPNIEVTAIDYKWGFIKVAHQNDTVYVFSDSFKDIPEVYNQVKSISNAEKDRLKYYEYIKELEIKYKDSVKLAEGIEVLAREQNEVANYAKKLYTKYKSLGSPLAFSEASVTYNSIGIPEANLSVFNITDKDIDAFEVSILCYDNYNRPVGHYLHRSNVFKGISQDLIEPSKESYGTWTLYGYENTTKVTIVLKSVHYKGKGAWYPKNKISIKSE